MRWPLVIGAGSLIVTGAVMLAMSASSSVAALVGMSALFGLTNGFSNFANQATLYTQSPAETIATAAGLLRTFAYLGAIFSASVIGAAFGPHVTDAGFHRLAWAVVAIGTSSLLLIVLDRKIPITVDSSPGR